MELFGAVRNLFGPGVWVVPAGPVLAAVLRDMGAGG